MKIGIVGAGTMGAGISQTFAQNGYDIILCSSSIESAVRGKRQVEKRISSRVKKGKMSQKEAELVISKIATGTINDLSDCDLVIESIVEKLEEKQKLFTRLQSVCRQDCILATNTSSLSITEIAMGINLPVVGMHFFNPAPVMKLVEITSGLNTPREAVDKVIKIAEELGKTPVEVKENAGFVVNRILIPMINEAIGLYAEGIADIVGIDAAMKLGANHPMGPLALGDLIGLDICLAIMEVLQAETGDSKYRPHPLLRKMVRGGWLGVKTGKGFYIYDDNGVRPSEAGRN